MRKTCIAGSQLADRESACFPPPPFQVNIPPPLHFTPGVFPPPHPPRFVPPPLQRALVHAPKAGQPEIIGLGVVEWGGGRGGGLARGRTILPGVQANWFYLQMSVRGFSIRKVLAKIK